ncbi:MAG: FliI/YscN family ATPase [Acidobacteriota bacterium]|nr:FliI/YscN family ATPase [Acidobacteriota bacterium]
MQGGDLLQAYQVQLARRASWRWTGEVREAGQQTVIADGPLCSVGECCEVIERNGRRHPGEVIGFRGRRVLAMPLRNTEGIQYGDRLQALGMRPSLPVGAGMVGSLVDAMAMPLDGRRAPHPEQWWPLDGVAVGPLERVPISAPLETGVRVLDGMLTVGRGQRVGIFGGSGVGKSTLIGMMTRGTAADVTVIGLVGERGREVREFVEESLGEEGRRRASVFVATAEESPLLRMRAAQAAMAAAEYFASQGKHVLLVLDSLTRYAMAAREVGLAAGEPPTSKGYTPSVFTRMARLVERAGNFSRGSITAFFTVLMEGDDQQDPIVDAVRSYLDGHVVLSRTLASSGHYPPIDVLDSLSRLMPAVTSEQHRKHAAIVRSLLATYRRSEDLIRIGAYKTGTDRELDRAVVLLPQIEAYLQQRSDERISLESSIVQLEELTS